jgi:23S rRNA (uridine2552-2'-O)-methyltransferase
VSKLSDRRRRHDAFHRRAKQAGFVARSVYKLVEIDEQHRLLTPGARVLDLGCRPGSWLQYAASKVGPAGVLVGIDREPLDIVIPGARIVIGDVLTIDPAVLRGELTGFDVVLSDLAPDTSGVRHVDQARSEALFEQALAIAEASLVRGGNFVGKLFQGPDFTRLIGRCRERFAQVKVVKPKSSRDHSIEQYVVAKGLSGGR